MRRLDFIKSLCVGVLLPFIPRKDETHQVDWCEDCDFFVGKWKEDVISSNIPERKHFWFGFCRINPLELGKKGLKEIYGYQALWSDSRACSLAKPRKRCNHVSEELS